MSAGGAVQAALTTSLGAIDALTGVYDGPPARASFPYASIDAGSESDWSYKDGVGREVLIAVTLWDEQPARLQDIADQTEALMTALASVEDWQLVTLRLLRRRVLRDVAGPWAAALDFRARLLAA